MGGLRRLMPVTFATMTIGLAALAGPAAVRRLLLQGGGARGGRGDRPARRRPGRRLGRLAGARRRARDGRRHRGVRHPALADDVLRPSRAAGVARTRAVGRDALAAGRARRPGDGARVSSGCRRLAAGVARGRSPRGRTWPRSSCTWSWSRRRCRSLLALGGAGRRSGASGGATARPTRSAALGPAAGAGARVLRRRPLRPGGRPAGAGRRPGGALDRRRRRGRRHGARHRARRGWLSGWCARTQDGNVRRTSPACSRACCCSSPAWWSSRERPALLPAAARGAAGRRAGAARCCRRPAGDRVAVRLGVVGQRGLTLAAVRSGRQPRAPTTDVAWVPRPRRCASTSASTASRRRWCC